MSLKILGVMTGTSCDGLDAACVEFSLKNGKPHWQFLWEKSTSYPSSLRKRVLAFQIPQSRHTSLDWLKLHRDLGIWYGRTLAQLQKQTSQKPDLIANHGQTLAHFPSPQAQGMTLQLGDPTRIAQETGLTLLSNFRDGDLSAGGQGAPLAPGFHQILIRKLRSQFPKFNQEGISIHNLGGISNFTYFAPEPSSHEPLAFDTGPANCWIDEAVAEVTHGKLKFDKKGAMALRSSPDLASVRKVLKNSYFQKAPPKSTGRDEFPYVLFRKTTRSKGEALVATATAITVESIAQAYEKWVIQKGLPLHRIYLSGGGAKNHAIVQGLLKHLPKTQILDVADLGLTSQSMEAVAFAFLGFQSLFGQPLGGSWTGNENFSSPAHIIPGRNWATVLNKIAQLKAF